MEQHPIKINKVQIRNLQIEDYAQLSQSFTRVYSDGSDVFWTHAQIKKLISIFPEGQIVTVVDDKIVGCALSIIVDYDKVKNDHTYAQVTGKETFNTHNPEGNILYGIEVFIHPGYRGLRLARRMYEYRKELCETLNLKAIMFGGRIPNYHKYADKMRPKEYIARVRQREIYDPVLTFQLSNDFHVRKVMTNYLPNDEESKHYACLLQWDNISRLHRNISTRKQLFVWAWCNGRCVVIRHWTTFLNKWNSSSMPYPIIRVTLSFFRNISMHL